MNRGGHFIGMGMLGYTVHYRHHGNPTAVTCRPLCQAPGSQSTPNSLHSTDAGLRYQPFASVYVADPKTHAAVLDQVYLKSSTIIFMVVKYVYVKFTMSTIPKCTAQWHQALTAL